MLSLASTSTRIWVSRLMPKPTKWHVRPAKTLISLGIRPVWSESSLSAWRKLGSLATHWADSKTDQNGRMPRLIWVFAGRTCHFVGFVMRRLKCHWPTVQRKTGLTYIHRDTVVVSKTECLGMMTVNTDCVNIDCNNLNRASEQTLSCILGLRVTTC